MSPRTPDLSPNQPQTSANPPGLVARGVSWVKAFATERLGLEDLQKLAAKKRVPIHRSTVFYFLGGMALFLFIIQIITGILLSLYYKPSPDQAFESVRAIMTEIDFGWLIRSIHSWSANLLVGVLFLHLFTTYIMRAYQRPREATWITGVALLGLFLAFGFSGYLLPWNQLAFFATRVGTQIMGAVPVIGHEMLQLARSGEEVTGDTLARFYSLHVVILPLATLGLLGVHLFLVQKHGMSVPAAAARRAGGAEKVRTMPFVPHFLLRDMVGWYLALGLLAALAALFPWELGQKANPFGSAPEGIRPEWYFLFMFETLKQLPGHVLGIEGEIVGVLFFGACGAIVLLVPFLDWRADQGRRRPILNVLATFAVFGFIFQSISGLDLAKFTLVQSMAYSAVATVVYWIPVLLVGRSARGGTPPALSWFLLPAVLAVACSALAAEAPPPAPAEAPPPAPAEAPPPAPAETPAAGPAAAAAATPAKAADAAETAAKPNNCLLCHGNEDVWEGDRLRFHVTEKAFAHDIHWAKGLRCADCHGGNPATENVNEAHAAEDGFRSLRQAVNGEKDFSQPPDRARIVELCGDCHAKIEYMKNFNPSPRVDQLREYWTSGHGHRLKENHDTNVATCVSCHSVPHGTGRDPSPRGIRAVKDLESPVYVKNVAKTCSQCHSNAKLMASYQYHNKPIGHTQYEEWRQSVHGKALMDKSDLSAPACNSCHGNHGAVPPQVNSVANACGTCHGKIAGLFAKTEMRHAFEQVGLPGCATCHSSHKIRQPSDAMLGLMPTEVCSRCHAAGPGQKANAAILAGFDSKRILHGGEVAKALRESLENLKRKIAATDAVLEKAERLGMLVPGPKSNPKVDPRIYFRKAQDALTNARVSIHTFDTVPVNKAVDEGLTVVAEVHDSAERALAQYRFRRQWLAGSLLPIGLVVFLLLLYIRRMPIPPSPKDEA